MLDLKETQESFETNVNLSSLTLEPIPVIKKPTDKRGYMYILKDSAFPGYVKVGRTSDPKKRLATYNTDKPFKTASFTVISNVFVDVVDVERIILDQLYSETSPTTLTKEWFEKRHYDLILFWIKAAESQAETI